jgi:hypothetical protein
MQPIVGAHHEPCVLLALSDHWTFVALRSALLEQGYEVHGITGVTAALLTSGAGGIRPTVVVVEESRLTARDRLVLECFRALDAAPAIVLVMGTDIEIPPGPWDQVLQRPMTPAALAGAIENVVGRTSHRLIERPSGTVKLGAFEIRLGLPWPMIGCRRCSARRHCDPPRTWSEQELVRLAIVKFALEHERCASLPSASSSRRSATPP